MPERLQIGMNSVMVDAPLFLFTSVYRPPAGAAADLRAVADTVSGGIETPYVLCALVASWHPTLRRVLADSDPAARGAIAFTASPEIAPWEPSAVMLLGDAIHTIPPIGGLGGNTAMRDARLLSQQLSSVARGERDLLDAVRDCEAEMRDYGYAAIRAALKDQSLATGRLGALTTRAWFRLCHAVPALRQRTFRRWDAAAAPRPWEHRATAA